MGEFASLTGQEAAWGVMSHHGTEMAIAELNAKGGALGKQFELLTEDDQSKQGEDPRLARKSLFRGTTSLPCFSVKWHRAAFSLKRRPSASGRRFP